METGSIAPAFVTQNSPFLNNAELGITFVMVTHDQEEALSLSDRIGVMRAGKIEQVGTPTEIYERPLTPFVANFIGDTNLLEGQLEQRHNTYQVTTPTGLKLLVQPAGNYHPGQTVMVSIRPEKITLSLDGRGKGDNSVEGRLQDVMYLGTHFQYVVQLLTGETMMVMQPNHLSLSPSADVPIYLSWLAQDCLALSNG